jgi:AraC family transcriptional regulator
LPQDRSTLRILDGPADFQGGSVVWLAHRLYEEFQLPDPFSYLAVQGLTLEIIAAASRCLASIDRRTPPPWLARAMEILRSSFTDRLSLSRLAQEVGIHEVYLARAFRRHTHCSVGEYIRRLRIEFACRQLAASREPLCEIALACGFADQSHFSRTFKRLIGMTPAAFRTSRRTRSGGS